MNGHDKWLALVELFGRSGRAMNALRPNLGVVDDEKYGRLLADPIIAVAQFARTVGRFPSALAVRDQDGVFLETGGYSMVNFGSNDYLGLATDETVIVAAVQAAGRWGEGASGSRLFAGDLTLHTDLEHAIADFLGGGRGAGLPHRVHREPGPHRGADQTAGRGVPPTGQRAR